MVSPMNQIIEQSRSTMNISYTNGLAAAYGSMRAPVAIQGGGMPTLQHRPSPGRANCTGGILVRPVVFLDTTVSKI